MLLIRRKTVKGKSRMKFYRITALEIEETFTDVKGLQYMVTLRGKDGVSWMFEFKSTAKQVKFTQKVDRKYPFKVIQGGRSK